jgi:ABC-2 type transport system ATP-binding protein
MAGAIDAVTGGSSKDSVCMSLADGDAVDVAEPTLKAASPTSFDIDGSTPQFNAVLGTMTSLAGTGARDALLADQTLMTVPAGGMVLAGIPKVHLEITGLTGAEMGSCAAPQLTLDCDPILFLAIGHRAPGASRWQIIDDEITPVRGFGTHDLEMNGIAERLPENEEVALLIYAFHAQFPVTWSRDIFVPAVNLTGTIDLPVRGATDILRTRIVPPSS